MNINNIQTKFRSPFLLLIVLVLISGQLMAAGDTVKVVNIAYGTQHYNRVTSSISTIYANELVKRASSSSVGEALIGRLPGLTVIQSSGEPNSTPRLFIRGRNTWGTNQPLVIIDGFKGDYTQLNIYEIESISILKDAASTALYGMDGANGVILVTTKRVGTGKTRIDVNINTGIQQPMQLPQLLNAANYAKLYNQASLNDNPNAIPRYSAADIAAYGREDGTYPFTHPDNNYYREVLKKWTNTTVGAINLSGGGDKFNYIATLGFVYNGGMLKNTRENDNYSTQNDMSRFNFRTILEVNVLKGLTSKVNVSGYMNYLNRPGILRVTDAFNIRNSPQGIIDIFKQIGSTPPQEYPIFNQNGTLGGTASYPLNVYGLISRTGYVSTLMRNADVKIDNRYEFDGALKGLYLGISGTLSSNMALYDGKIKTFSVSKFNYSTNTSQAVGVDGDLITNNAPVFSDIRYAAEGNIGYNKSFGNHELNLLAMSHLDSYRFSTDYFEMRNAGLGFRANYGFKKRYYAEIASGYYGQELFARGHRFGLFPAASASWIISNEKFLNGSKVINYLKLRGSWGMVGGTMSFPTNVAVSGASLLDQRIYYQDYFAYYTTPIAFGNNQNPAAGDIHNPAFMPQSRENFVGNPNLTWDKSYKTDFGMEAVILNHINFMFTYFRDNRKDILSKELYYPALTGMVAYGRQPWMNRGEVINKGYETTVQVYGKLGELEYSVNGGLWYAKNKIISQPEAMSYSVDDANAVGKSINQYLGLISTGFYPSGTTIGASSNPFQTYGNVGPGDARYQDRNGDKVIDINDRVPLGFNDLPEYTYTFGFDLKYKGFYLSVAGQGTMNGSVMFTADATDRVINFGEGNIYRTTGAFIPLTNNGNTFEYANNSWTAATASTATLPRLSITRNANNSQPSSLWVHSTDYFKLRSAELGYNFPEHITKKLMMKNLTLFCRGLNLFTIADDINFVDPETVSINTYPAMRSISIGITSRF